MKIKKIAVFILTIMLFTAISTAHATLVSTSNGLGQRGGVTTITATYEPTEIIVSVPTSAQVYINPTSVPVQIGGEVDNGQILSEPSYIENQSKMPLQVSVTVSGDAKADSNMKLSATTTKGTALTSKTAFLFFDMRAVGDPDRVTWTKTYDEEKHIIVRPTSKTKKDMVTLGPADTTTCFGAFRLNGDCVANPKEEWTEKDGVDVKISFTFTPIALH